VSQLSTRLLTADIALKGRFLGRGATGDVYETVIQGRKLAHKRVVVRRKIGDAELKEIEILKKLSSHTHMIQLVGTYTHRQFLGLLLHPVAVCDLHTFFEDVEAWSNVDVNMDSSEARLVALDALHKDRLEALGYDFPTSASRSKASTAYLNVGCLISAIEYLHEQKIRHKDLKPSNILLSRDRLWLSDFGSATDFSLLSQSATDNERGTPRYFSPEVNSTRSTPWTLHSLISLLLLGCNVEA
jgi:serine/threonine protein kinase